MLSTEMKLNQCQLKTKYISLPTSLETIISLTFAATYNNSEMHLGYECLSQGPVIKGQRRGSESTSSESLRRFLS